MHKTLPHLEAVEAYTEGCSAKHCANLSGISQSTMIRHLHKIGKMRTAKQAAQIVERRMPRKVDELEIAHMARLYKQGWPMDNIARALDRSPSVVQRWIQRLKLPIHPPKQRKRPLIAYRFRLEIGMGDNFKGIDLTQRSVSFIGALYAISRKTGYHFKKRDSDYYRDYYKVIGVPSGRLYCVGVSK